MLKVVTLTLTIMFITWFIINTRKLQDQRALGQFVLSLVTGIGLGMGTFCLLSSYLSLCIPPESWASEYQTSYDVKEVVYDGNQYHIIKADGDEEIQTYKRYVVIEEAEKGQQMTCDEYYAVDDLTYQAGTVYHLHKPVDISIKFDEQYRTEGVCFR